MPTVPESNGHVRVEAPGFYVTASVAIVDNGAVVAAEVLNSGIPIAGLVIKQKTPNRDLGRASLRTIDAGEGYYLWIKDEVRIKIPAGLTPQLHKPLWVDPVDNSIKTADAAGLAKLGVISEVAGGARGVPAGFMTVNQDLRSII